ncbi:uncharacterized protein BX663DRAFT_548869 [Cokeromyces recurvatus]|uniref:uncharacterized protein n=1 Tax=Cokeromyces recurvatus TaxID=90255 RepID=UPI0022202017|nr:uncharacterized protein BX663DRAFT_548869 [Cokeromyces recurvatus]KAI7906711.1 hypothetical protein BX663DRAFT_548869 [Cokeromyces recurvatus]
MDQLKIKQILKEIDLARCQGQWSVVKELMTKKYMKYKPDDLVFNMTICTEVELIQLLKLNKKKGDDIYQHDTPYRISLSPSIDPINVQPLLDRFMPIISNESAAVMDWYVQFSKILLARIYFESGQYQNTLDILQHLALRIEDVESGYGLIWLVQARTMKGICLEINEDIEAAIETYEAAWNMVESKLPYEKGIMLSFWLEECLYRACLLKLRLNHPAKEILTLMSAYLQLASSYWNPHWHMFKRWVLFKIYAEYMIKIYQDDTYIAVKKNSNGLATEMNAFDELSTLMDLFRQLFTLITPYLSVEDQAQYGMSLCHIMMNSHDVIGWGEIKHIRKILQFLHQVKKLTFNHPTINRYMFYTLIRLGSLEEAKYAFQSYLDLMDLPKLEADATLLFSSSSSDPSFLANERGSHLFRKSSTYVEESPERVIQILLDSIYLYGHEEENSRLAVYLSELCLGFLQQLKGSLPLESHVYRLVGSSYTLLAIQSDEGLTKRTGYHQRANDFFQRAIALNVGTDWKSYYGLGFLQTMTHHVHDAIVSIQRSIEINPHFIASWHLLALLYSCKTIDHLEKAKEVIEAGLLLLSQQQQQGSNDDNNTGFHLSTLSSYQVNDAFDRAENYLLMNMTRLALIESGEGAEAAMKHYENLFSIYTLLSKQLGIDLNGDLKTQENNQKDDDDIDIGVEIKKTRKKSSSFSLIRRSSFTSIANSITSHKSYRLLGRPRSSSVEVNHSSHIESVDMMLVSEKDSTKRKSSYHRDSRKQYHSMRHDLTPRRSYSASTSGKKRGENKEGVTIIGRIGTANSSLPPLPSHDSLFTFLISPSYSKGSSNNISGRQSNSSSLSSLFLRSYQERKAMTADIRRGTPLVSSCFQHSPGTEIRRRARWRHLLATLWLMSARTFIRVGLLEEANKALGEAEEVALDDPNVWYQLGQLNLQVYDIFAKEDLSASSKRITDRRCHHHHHHQSMMQEVKQIALDAFEKALMLDPNHVPSQVVQARQQWSLAIADLMMEQLTARLGWNSSEAWYQYAQIKKQQGQFEEMKSFLLFALELTENEPIIKDYIHLFPKFLKK